MAHFNFKILLVSFVTVVISGCSISGSVINQHQFETRLSNIKLENPGTLKVYCGGTKRMVPLSMIHTVIVNPGIRLTIDNELYYSAEITLRDGNNIQSIEKEKTLLNNAFICVHGVLTGKNEKDTYSTGLENILRITIE